MWLCETISFHRTSTISVANCRNSCSFFGDIPPHSVRLDAAAPPTAKPRALTGCRSHRRIHQISPQWLSLLLKRTVGVAGKPSMHFANKLGNRIPAANISLQPKPLCGRVLTTCFTPTNFPDALIISGVTSAWGSFIFVGLWMGFLMTLYLPFMLRTISDQVEVSFTKIIILLCITDRLATSLQYSVAEIECCTRAERRYYIFLSHSTIPLPLPPSLPQPVSPASFLSYSTWQIQP